MIPSLDLFYLIKSLKAGEKRSFKLYASRHKGDKQYIKLFNAIEKQKIYREEKLVKLFEGEKTGNQFPVAKHSLYSLILKCMHSYHSDSSVVAKLSELLHNTEFLYNKGLYPQCNKQLKKAKEIAELYEKHVHQLEIYRWEQKILVASGNPEKMERSFEERFDAEMIAVKKIKNTIEYKRLANRSFGLQKKIGAARDGLQQTEFRKITNNPLLRNGEKAIGYESKAHYYNILSIYHITTGDLQQGYGYSKKYVDLFEKHPVQKKEDADRYIFALNNHIAVCRLLKKYAEFDETLVALKNVACEDIEMEAKVFVRASNFELSLYNQTGDFKKGVASIRTIAAGMEKYKTLISHEFEMVLYFQFARLLFGTGEYSKALQWLNKIINDTRLDSRQDIICFARIFNLVIHFELNNTDLLSYAVRSTYRFLNKRERLYEFENVILRFIKNRMPDLTSEKELKKAFTELRSELADVLKKPFEKRILDYFDIIAWLESKTKKR